MEINLERPLTFFDLETTGPDRVNDKITSFCFHTFFPDGTNDVYEALVNPGRPIPPHVAQLTGIDDEMVKTRPSFSTYARDILDIVGISDLVGYGCLMFDVPLLFTELHNAGWVWDYTKNAIVDACNIYKRQVPRDLSSALKYYCNRQLLGAHTAKADVDATRLVFLHQIERHELSTNISELALYSNYGKPMVDVSGKFSLDAEGDIIFNFSQKKGEKAKHHPDLLWWILSKEFTEDVKIVCRKILDEVRPTVVARDSDELPF